jgi:hypothetical protein
VVVSDPNGNEILRRNLERAWPKKYSVSDADVTGQDLAVETFELVAERINKVKALNNGRAVTYANS